MYLHSIVLKLYPSFPIKCSIIMGFFINWGNGRLEPARARETGLVWQVYQSYYCYIYTHTLYKYKLLLYMKRCVPNMA